jgi:hypothetical protein
LSRFTGSSSISSDDYFGRPPKRSTRGTEGPDLTQFKDGVANLGSKLSSVANNMFETIQDRYDNYRN